MEGHGACFHLWSLPGVPFSLQYPPLHPRFPGSRSSMGGRVPKAPGDPQAAVCFAAGCLCRLPAVPPGPCSMSASGGWLLLPTHSSQGSCSGW